jgi:spoIIIJ-associated protein
MQQFEFEARNVEEAIHAACQQLGSTREELEVEILEPGSAGIFGLVGGRKAKIRVSLKHSAPAPAPAQETTDYAPLAKETLERILALMPVEGARVAVELSDGAVTLLIEGDHSGLLIGRKGQTLDALQFIVGKILNKAAAQRVQVVVDSENYRQRRRDSLIQMALRLGDKVKRIRKPVTTNPLNPHDRRIVHLALRDDPELDTKSRGEGILKKVLIIPKKEDQGRASEPN